jgi:hypothetical protein
MPAHITPRTLVATLAAALLLATATSSATARILSFSNQNIRITWSSLEFASVATVRCRVTLEGSFHARTVAKVRGTLIGALTRMAVDTENCTGGRGRPRTELLPGHITFEGFRGALPTIDSVYALISRVRFQIICSGIATCDYGTSTTNITGAITTEGSGGITGLAPVTGRNIAVLHTGTAFCPGTGTFAGTASVMLLGTTNRVSVSLI